MLFADNTTPIELPIWVAIAGAVITLMVVPLLTLLINSWINVRKQRTEDKVRSEAAAVLVQRETSVTFREDREEAQRIEHAERDHVIALVRAQTQEMLDERRKAHTQDVKRLETQLGSVVRELKKSRKGEQNCRIQAARMAEIMRLKGLISETEEFEILRTGEDDSDADDEPAG